MRRPWLRVSSLPRLARMRTASREQPRRSAACSSVSHRGPDVWRRAELGGHALGNELLERLDELGRKDGGEAVARAHACAALDGTFMGVLSNVLARFSDGARPAHLPRAELTHRAVRHTNRIV